MYANAERTNQKQASSRASRRQFDGKTTIGFTGVATRSRFSALHRTENEKLYTLVTLSQLVPLMEHKNREKLEVNSEVFGDSNSNNFIYSPTNIYEQNFPSINQSQMK